MSAERRNNLESALADIMLLGGETEIKASDQFQRDFAKGKPRELKPVIESLRTSLRNELSLDEVELPKLFLFRLNDERESGDLPAPDWTEHLLHGRVSDTANILRKVNQAQKSKTGQELTDERRQQILDAYDLDRPTGAHLVLWVDDNDDWITAEREMLEAADVSIVWVPNTSRALDLLNGNVFDAVITDMGRVEGPREGYALLDAMRRRGDETPLVVYSGSGDPDHEREVLKHGGQGATNDPSRLFELVMKWISS